MKWNKKICCNTKCLNLNSSGGSPKQFHSYPLPNHLEETDSQDGSHRLEGNMTLGVHVDMSRRNSL